MSNLIIIGTGPGGYKAAGYAAEKGLTVTIFEAKRLGGTCLNEGCIPTKTLIHESEYAEKRYYDDYKNQSKLYALAVARKDKLVSFLREKNYENVKEIIDGNYYKMEKNIEMTEMVVRLIKKYCRLEEKT